MASGSRGGLTADSFNTPGTRPGSTRAISQRKAVAEGYEAAPSKRMTKTNQPEGKTGCTSAPGLTHRGGHKGR